MTRSNRTLNRVILFLLGLTMLVLAAGAGWLLLERSPQPELPRALPDELLVPVAAAAAVAILLGILWIATRGRGVTGTAVSDDGLEIASSVVQDLLREALDRDADVVHVAVRASRLRSRTVLEARISVRRGADPVRVAESSRRALARVDVALGRRLPCVLHLTSGLRSRTSATTRVV